LASIWVISDDKVGHVNQSLGLAQALQAQRPGWSLEQFPALSKGSALKALLTGRIPFIAEDKTPQFVIGAGGATHLTLLAVARATGARSVVLSGPALPFSCFDFCILPQHDNPGSAKNLLTTRGALNRMHSAPVRPDTGMILVGGPAGHCGWDQAALLDQVKTITGDTSIRWLLTTSRRTPSGTEDALRALQADNLQVTPFDDTDSHWLRQNLPGSEFCWVTADSVSMVYDALTAGCRTGILPVPITKRSRVVRGYEQLIEDGIVGQYQGTASSRELPRVEAFNEAQRAAEFLLGSSTH